MKNAALSERLSVAAEFVRQGAVFADVGTDHAYLPIFLLENGRITKAFALDINEGPLNKARENAKNTGFFDKMEFILTDGALALSDKGITDVAICGMGGELIADIIERAPFLKDSAIRLILQPMTKQAHLRRYLAERGFKILEESFVSEERHHYTVMKVEFCNEPYEISDIEAEIGALELDFTISRRAYAEEKLRALKKAAFGMASGGISTEREDRKIREIEKILKG